MMEERSKFTHSALTIAVGLLSAGASAAYAERFTEWAQVVSSTPVVQRVGSPPGDRIAVEVTVAPGAPVLSGIR